MDSLESTLSNKPQFVCATSEVGWLHAPKAKCQFCAAFKPPLRGPGSALHNNEQPVLQLLIIRATYRAKEL
eukprot:1151277-Pelagomonas_calceolata.AAC.1